MDIDSIDDLESIQTLRDAVAEEEPAISEAVSVRASTLSARNNVSGEVTLQAVAGSEDYPPSSDEDGEFSNSEDESSVLNVPHKKGMTRMPKRLIRQEAIIDLTYIFIGEEDFFCRLNGT